MTKVINLYAASGVGKSTTAAGLFYEMKLRGINCELVQEFVKSWAWSGKSVGRFDQPLLFGEQTQREAILYGKVDYIISDSPLYIYGFYENKYAGRSIVGNTIKPYLNYVKEQGIEHINFFLERHKKYNPAGRYETKEQSEQNHIELKKYLIDNNVDIIDVPVSDRDRVNFILNYLGL